MAGAAGAGGVGAGQRRPDQHYGAPAPGLVPGSRTGNLRARSLAIFGTGNGIGLFVYSSVPPAKGTLVAAIVPPGVTQDPYGNTVSAVANFGTWNAAGTLLQHFGINNSGDTFLVNNAGKIIQHARSSDGSTFFYNTSGEGAGNQIASIAAAGGTNPAGDTFVDGIAAYSGAIFAQLHNGVLVLRNPGVNSTGAIISAGNPGIAQFASPLETVADVSALLSLVSQAASSGGAATNGTVAVGPSGPATAALLEVQGSQALKGIAIPVSPPAGNALLFSDVNGFERMLPGLAGDTAAYQIGENIQISAGFTISSTTPQTILSVPVGIGTYVVEVWFVSSNATPADAAGWAFTGPAAGVQLVAFESKSGTSPATVGYGASATYTTTFNSQGVGGNQDILLRATIAFTAAGTLAITGKQLVALNNVTVFGGWMRVRHMS